MSRLYGLISLILISVWGTSVSSETTGKEGWYVAFSPYWHTGNSVDKEFGVKFAESKFKNSLGLLFAIGRRFEGGLGVELEASFRKVRDSMPSYIDGDTDYFINGSLNSVMLNGLYYVPDVIEFAEPYFGAGVGIVSISSASVKDEAAIGQIVTGLNIPVNDSFSTRVGYRYAATGKFRSRHKGHTIDYKSHNFEVGIIYNF